MNDRKVVSMIEQRIKKLPLRKHFGFTLFCDQSEAFLIFTLQLVLRPARFEIVSIQHVDIVIDPTIYSLNQSQISSILHHVFVLTKEFGFEPQKELLLDKDLLIIAKAKIQTLIPQIGAVLAVADGTILIVFQLLDQFLVFLDLLAAVLDLNILAVLDCHGVLRFQVVDLVLIDTGVLLVEVERQLFLVPMGDLVVVGFSLVEELVDCLAPEHHVFVD